MTKITILQALIESSMPAEIKTRGMFGKHMLRGFKWPPGRLHFKEFSTFKLGFYDDVPLRSTLG